MSDISHSVLVGIPDIAAAAGVGNPAVGNWRKRHGDFPSPKVQAPSGALFDLREIERWLVENGKITGSIPRETVLLRLIEGFRATWTVEELTAYLGAVLVYLEACERSESDDHAQLVVDRADRWESVRDTSNGQLNAALRRACVRIEDQNLSLAGLILPGMKPRSTADPALVRDTLDTIEQAARGAGNSRAELFELITRQSEKSNRFRAAHATPDVLADLATRLVHPISGTILDLAVGEGSMLREAAKKATGTSTYTGYEYAPEAVGMARRRFFLGELNATVHSTDVFGVPADEFPTADIVLLDPPFGQRQWGDADIYLSERWTYGAPSAKSADLAWLQLAALAVNPGGRAAVLQPLSSLTATEVDLPIKSEMLQAGIVEAVILLPSRLRPDISGPVALWLLRHPTDAVSDDVLLVDGSHLGTAGRSEHTLEEVDVQRIVGAVEAVRAGTPLGDESDIACVVPLSEVLDNKADATPSSYRPQEVLDIAALKETATEQSEKLRLQTAAVSQSIHNLVDTVVDARDTTRSGTFGSERLIDLATVSGGTARAKLADSGEVSLFGLTEIATRGNAPQRFVERSVLLESKTVLLDPGDVVVALAGAVGHSAVVPPSLAGSVLGKDCAALRSTDHRVTSQWLSAWTKSADFAQQVDRELARSATPRMGIGTLGELMVPVPTDDAGRADLLRVSDIKSSFDSAEAEVVALQTHLQTLVVAQLGIEFARITQEVH